MAQDPEFLELVDRALDEDELHFARVLVSTASGYGTMFRGRFVECQIARLLHARHPPRGTSPWDLWLPGRGGIEVKSSAGGSFAISEKADKDVRAWIFASLGPPGYRSIESTFFVLANRQVRRLRAKRRVSVSQLASMTQPTSLAGLTSAVERILPPEGGRRGAR